MVFDITSAVIIQDPRPIVNGKREIPPGNFFGEFTVDITVWITQWIMCKTPFPEGVRQGDGAVMKK